MAASTPHAAGGPTDAEARELAALRERVAVLEARPRRHRARSFLSALLIVVACVLAPLGAIAVWASDVVGDTDRYVATMAPLASNPDVQAALETRITDAVMQHIDIATLLGDVAPADRPRLEQALGALGGPITSGISDLVHSTTARFVTSPAFATIWTELNRRAHDAVDNALTGNSRSAVKLTDNAVTIDLAPVIDQVKQQLVGAGLSVAAKIPEIHTSFTVVQSKDVGKIKTGFRLLQLMGNWLPVIALLLAAGGILLAAARRRALLATALGVAAAMAVLGIGLAVFRTVYLNALPPNVSSAAAGAVYDALIRFLRVGIRTVITLGVLVAVGAWLSGPNTWAVRVRTAWRSAIGAVRAGSGLPGGPVGPWVNRFKPWLTWGAVAAGAVAFVLWPHPTAMVTFWLALAVVLVLAVVEFLAAEPVQARPSIHA